MQTAWISNGAGSGCEQNVPAPVAPAPEPPEFWAAPRLELKSAPGKCASSGGSDSGSTLLVKNVKMQNVVFYKITLLYPQTQVYLS